MTGVRTTPRVDHVPIVDLRWRHSRVRGRLAPTVVVLWAVAWFVALGVHGGGSWHFFHTGGQVLSDLDDGSRAGLHVYAEHPLLQIGPLALAAAWALGWISQGHGLGAAESAGALMGVVVVLLVRRIARRGEPLADAARRRERDLTLLAGVICFVPVWMYAAVSSTHLDDVMALTSGVVALALVRSGRAVWAGAALAIAVDSKPWALPLVVVLLALPSMRARLLGFATTAAGVALAWLPFFLADPQTVRALRYTIPTTALSGLHFFGVTAARTPPWDRPLQTLVGAALAGAAVWRGRTAGVLLLVLASRLALDPGTNRYYTAGLAAGALLWDVAGSRHRWPWWSATVVLFLHVARWFHALDPLHGPALVVFAVAASVAVLGGERVRAWGQVLRHRTGTVLLPRWTLRGRAPTGRA
ncbi:hypothetical protein ABEG17_17040 [Pedococcus sp. KACC 23699]|uniref:DUF2029 domain-containing protein n=1 Tax=Pedococcus sp. KACC 23699 TaxID=3149228 RepID=A0AAU7JST0_9MICO